MDDVILVCFMKGYANLYFHIPLLVKLGFGNLPASNRNSCLERVLKPIWAITTNDSRSKLYSKRVAWCRRLGHSRFARESNVQVLLLNIIISDVSIKVALLRRRSVGPGVGPRQRG